MIDSPTRTVYIPLGAGAELVGRLRAGERSRALFRQLGQYGVSICETTSPAALDQAGDLERLEDGSAIALPPCPSIQRKPGCPWRRTVGKPSLSKQEGAETLPSPLPCATLINIHSIFQSTHVATENIISHVSTKIHRYVF